MKNIVKPAFIAFLTSEPVKRVADRLFHNSVPVFMLHRVSPTSAQNEPGVTTDHFRNCLDYLVTNDYTLISLEKLINALSNNQKLPVKSVVFTIDDGYKEQAETAIPIALEYNCPITFFLITGMLDQSLWPWDAKVSWIIESSSRQSLESSPTVKKLNLGNDDTTSKKALRRSIQEKLKKHDTEFIARILQGLADDADLTIPTTPPSAFQPMTWDMVRGLENKGVHFAPHSATHQILSNLDKSSMEQEISNSWCRLKSELNNPLKVFCYPNGTALDFGVSEINFLKENGFLGAVTSIPKNVEYKLTSDNYIHSLPRLSLPDNMPEFIQYCSWIERARTVFA